jgi:hypothetical protein
MGLRVLAASFFGALIFISQPVRAEHPAPGASRNYSVTLCCRIPDWGCATGIGRTFNDAWVSAKNILIPKGYSGQCEAQKIVRPSAAH